MGGKYKQFGPWNVKQTELLIPVPDHGIRYPFAMFSAMTCNLLSTFVKNAQ